MAKQYFLGMGLTSYLGPRSLFLITQHDRPGMGSGFKSRPPAVFVYRVGSCYAKEAQIQNSPSKM